MKRIKLNERQYNKLFEEVGDSKFLDGNDSLKNFSSEVGTQAIISDPNDNKKMSKPISTDKFASQQTPQQWGWGNKGGKSTNTI